MMILTSLQLALLMFLECTILGGGHLSVGDVVFMFYPLSVKDHYRLARVKEVYPDEKNLVRTVKVCYRKRDSRETAAVYNVKPLIEEKVAIQRLSVLLPIEEQVMSS